MPHTWVTRHIKTTLTLASYKDRNKESWVQSQTLWRSKHITVISSCYLIQSSLLTGEELRDYFQTFGIKERIYLHPCLST